MGLLKNDVIMKRVCFLVLIFIAQGSVLADWYVDKDATGANSGIDWDNAWQNFTAINWDNIQAGDTLWLSGGTYQGELAIKKGGAPQTPIRVKVSQEPGHNDPVIIQGNVTFTKNWIILDGAKDDDFAATSIKDSTLITPLIKNNINLKIDTSALANISGIYVWNTALLGAKIKWVDIQTNHTQPSPGENLSSEAYGVRFSTGDVAQSEVAYTWVHDTGQDGIKMMSNEDPQWDDLSVHHCLIEQIGDDGIEASPGLTVHHSIIRETSYLNGHPDGIQPIGDHLRVYNNILYNWGTMPLYPGILTSKMSGVQIYGNLIYSRNSKYGQMNAVLLSVDASYGKYNPVEDDATWSDILIANNTFVAGPWYNQNGIENPLSFYNSKSSQMTLYLRGVVINNNIFYNGYNAALGVGGGPGGGISFNQADVQVDYNLMWSTVAEGFRIGYLGLGDVQTQWGVLLRDAEALNAATVYKNNKSTKPKFLDPTNFMFSLAQDDVAARDAGTDLSGLGLPGLGFDLAGIPRGQNGKWDIGAHEYAPGVIPAAPRSLELR